VYKRQNFISDVVKILSLNHLKNSKYKLPNEVSNNSLFKEKVEKCIEEHQTKISSFFASKGIDISCFGSKLSEIKREQELINESRENLNESVDQIHSFICDLTRNELSERLLCEPVELYHKCMSEEYKLLTEIIENNYPLLAPIYNTIFQLKKVMESTEQGAMLSLKKIQVCGDITPYRELNDAFIHVVNAVNAIVDKVSSVERLKAELAKDVSAAINHRGVQATVSTRAPVVRCRQCQHRAAYSHYARGVYPVPPSKGPTR